jgi:hypothetical protein
VTDRCDPEAESGPDGGVRLVSTSRASDGSFTAISEIGALLGDEQHRLIGGVAIVLHQHRLGLEHPVRSTADADSTNPHPRPLAGLGCTKGAQDSADTGGTGADRTDIMERPPRSQRSGRTMPHSTDIICRA